METVTTSAQLVCEVEVRCDPGFYRNSDQNKDKGHVVVVMVTGDIWVPIIRNGFGAVCVGL